MIVTKHDRYNAFENEEGDEERGQHDDPKLRYHEQGAAYSYCEDGGEQRPPEPGCPPHDERRDQTSRPANEEQPSKKREADSRGHDEGEESQYDQDRPFDKMQDPVALNSWLPGGSSP